MLMPAAASAQPCAAPPSAYACNPKDALIAWYKGEFAAANAIIDALCAHLAQIGRGAAAGGGGGGSPPPSFSGYEGVFAAVHRRRINWIPVLQWQTYYSVAEVADQLRRVTEDQQMPVNRKRNDAQAQPQPQQKPWHMEQPQKQQQVVTWMDAHHGEEQEVEDRSRDYIVDDQIKVVEETEIVMSPTTTTCSSSIAADADSTDDSKADSNGEGDEHHSPNAEPQAAAEPEINQEELVPPPLTQEDHDEEEEEAEVEDATAVAAAEENKEPAEEEYSHSFDSASVDPVQILDPCPPSSSDGDGASADAPPFCSHDEEEQQPHSSPMVEEVANGIICAGRHDDCNARRDRINVCKGFVAKEHSKGHMVNIVKGLKVYEDAFTDSELARLAECITQLRDAGQNGQLSGETYILFNKQLKGNKREILQFGVPVFQPTSTDEATSTIEPIPALLQDVIDHLIQWRLIPASKTPNGCIISFYDEDEHSQPYFKPPHLDNPLSTLLLHDTTMAFGKALTCEKDGNYKGSLKLQLREGSLVVMRGNSADMARHVICPSANSRVSITFVKVRPTLANTNQAVSSSSPTKSAIPLLLNPEMEGAAMGSPHSLIPAWGVGMAVQAPIVMLAPARPIPMNAIAKRTSRSTGTGVFLPWALGSKKYIKQLPPRIQRRRLPALPQPLAMQLEKASQIRCIAM